MNHDRTSRWGRWWRGSCSIVAASAMTLGLMLTLPLLADPNRPRTAAYPLDSPGSDIDVVQRYKPPELPEDRVPEDDDGPQIAQPTNPPERPAPPIREPKGPGVTNGPPPLAPTPPRVFPGPPRVAGFDSPARPLFQPQPALTPEMRKHAPGRVTIRFIIDEAGRVPLAKIAFSTHPVFEAPALKAVRRWRFEPARRDGRPTTARRSVTLHFALRR